MRRIVRRIPDGTKVVGIVDRDCIAFEPEGASSKDISDLADLLAKYLLQDAQLADLRKLMPDNDE